MWSDAALTPWWFVQNDERVCRVWSVTQTQDPQAPLIVRLSPLAGDTLRDSTGLFHVCHEHTDETYTAQALTCVDEPDGVRLSCSPLGEVEASTQGDDEDWLIIEGHQPTRLHEAVIAHASCDKGDHVRIEMNAAVSRRVLPPAKTPSPACKTCPHHGTCAASLLARHTWSFQRLASNPSAKAVCTLVRLARRRRYAVTLDVKCETCEVSVAIGHVRQRLSWPA